MIDAIFQQAALTDSQLLAQSSLSHVLDVWLQNDGKMEHPSSTHHGGYPGDNTLHFVYVSA